ncbi:MAG: recombinase family protein [Roseomonas mucosa]|nr:recombinase family protein [Roseomonas mucosa]
MGSTPARDAHFLLGLAKAGVEFLAVDMPYASRLTIGIMALVAEEEARAISSRTRVALAAAKARGMVLGNPQLRAGDSRVAALASEVWKRDAAKRAADVLPYITAARRAGATTLRQTAAALTARGVRTPMGKEVWSVSQVRRVVSGDLRPCCSGAC